MSLPKIQEIEIKQVLVPSKLGVTYCLNPYVGCLFGCAYCYAIFMSWRNHKDEGWGTWVDIKINAPQLLRKEVIYKKPGSIFISSVCDPYQGIETKYKITRKCLEILAEVGYPAPISILTKSPLVIRDIDLFKKLDIKVGMTVTSTGDAITQLLETHAPPCKLRIRALEKLHTEGISTYVFVGPLLPHLVEKPEELEKLFKILKNVGVQELWVEHLNLSPYIKKRLFYFLSQNLPRELPKFLRMENPQQRKRLDILVDYLLNKIKFKNTHIIKH